MEDAKNIIEEIKRLEKIISSPNISFYTKKDYRKRINRLKKKVYNIKKG